MSNLFINTIVQHGGAPSQSEKVVILNTISKHINKKMKLLEYKYRIKLKLSELPLDNWDCLPKSVGIQSFATIDGPIKGKIPFYTKTNINIPTPQITPITTAVPITPFGPVVGVSGMAINPFGNANTLEERINRAAKYLDIIISIDTELEKLNNGMIEKSKIDKKYFDFVDLDLDEPDLIDNLINYIGTNSNQRSHMGFSDL